MQILNSLPEDLEVILDLYDAAIAFQHSKGLINWISFDRQAVLDEINKRKQWKIVVDGQIACVFILEYNDPVIWQEKDSDPSVYIHRIATNPNFRGQAFIKHIIHFVKYYGRNLDKKFIRMDTTSGNEHLNSYYKSFGFKVIGEVKIKGNSTMPAHYQNNTFVLFEMPIESDF